MRVPASVSIPLERGRSNIALLAITIDSNLAGSLRLKDPARGPDRGHMSDDHTPLRVLSNPLTVRVAPTAAVRLDGPDGTVLTTSAGSSIVSIELGQVVGALDPPATSD
jgi:hypothetical protein